MFPVNDALDAILLGSFLFGVIFTVASFVLGVADVGLGHVHGGADVGGHGGDVGHGGDHGGLDHTILSLVNVSTILAFLTWFGGVGYLVKNGLEWGWILAIALALLGGVIGAAAIGVVFLKVIRPNDRALDPRDFEMVGTIARVTSSIRPGGYGEIVYELGGTRHASAALAKTAEIIPRDSEVVILRIERGAAVVARLDELLAETVPSDGG